MNTGRTRKTNKGFTLIELLVVITIIGILSVVVIASLQDARTKAENSGTVQQIDAYIKAAELYQLDYGKYPQASGATGDPTTARCIGDYPTVEVTANNSCGLLIGNYQTHESGTLKTAFLEKIPEFKAVGTKDVTVSNFPFRGATYRCSDSTCKGYVMYWMQQGDVSCSFGSSKSSSNGNTACTLTK